MSAKIVTTVFDYEKDRYERMYRVFQKSIRKNTSHQLDTIRITAPKLKRNQSFDSNTAKLNEWQRYLESQPEGAELIFMDCDMLVLKPLQDAFERNFDVA